MTRAAWLAAAPAVWATYAWGGQLAAMAGAARGRRSGAKIAMTFDDGPDPVHTPKILDVLARERVHASFFLIGERAEAAPDLARRIADEGHDLGNHTWSHRGLWRCGPAATREEIEGGHHAIECAAGRAPRFFRPPWGLTNAAALGVVRRLGTPCVFWSAQPEGRSAVSPDEQVRRVARRARPGAIVDLHDADGVPGAGARLVHALPAMIETLRRRGFALSPLRDLL